MSASGVRDYEADTPLGVFVPNATPAAVVTQLHKPIVTSLNSPETKKLVLAQGTELVGSPPAEFAVWLLTDIAHWTKLIRDKGLREE